MHRYPMGGGNRLDFVVGLGAAIERIMEVMEGQKERIWGEKRLGKLLGMMWKPSAVETF